MTTKKEGPENLIDFAILNLGDKTFGGVFAKLLKLLAISKDLNFYGKRPREGFTLYTRSFFIPSEKTLDKLIKIAEKDSNLSRAVFRQYVAKGAYTMEQMSSRPTYSISTTLSPRLMASDINGTAKTLKLGDFKFKQLAELSTGSIYISTEPSKEVIFFSETSDIVKNAVMNDKIRQEERAKLSSTPSGTAGIVGKGITINSSFTYPFANEFTEIVDTYRSVIQDDFWPVLASNVVLHAAKIEPAIIPEVAVYYNNEPRVFVESIFGLYHPSIKVFRDDFPLSFRKSNYWLNQDINPRLILSDFEKRTNTMTSSISKSLSDIEKAKYESIMNGLKEVAKSPSPLQTYTDLIRTTENFSKELLAREQPILKEFGQDLTNKLKKSIVQSQVNYLESSIDDSNSDFYRIARRHFFPSHASLTSLAEEFVGVRNDIFDLPTTVSIVSNPTFKSFFNLI